MKPREYSMVDVAPTVSAILGIRPPSSSCGQPIQEITQDMAGRDKVAVLAPDAFGWFAWELWQQEMPFLQELHGAHSLILRSVLPSITPVNFSTMVTGTTLEGHGVKTYRHDFLCETLFDTVRAAGGKSAGIGFEGYTGGELLARFSDIDGTTERGEDSNIVEKVRLIAERDKPRFLIAQLGRVDDIFHKYGPSSPQVVPMVRDLDKNLKNLVEFLVPLGYAVLILADHGQHDIIDDPNTHMKGGHGSDSDTDCQVPLTWK
ncbi:MAG: alkaline phosphatase family protein [Anaerolineae bacterium]|nr:alkaline phosphatase family protein [Anaerolineae bacterium]